ncbi:MAG: ATP-binding protein [Actinomycetota bacterium]|nr:ATP-binding protein [Actinomycetota bacterium]
MKETEGELHELLSNRVAADPHLSSRCKDLLTAAFDSAEHLAAVLRGEVPVPTAADTDPSPPSGPTGIYLGAIRVRSFRGIGPKACLDLRPGPGLTVVTERNGSGKSSFAEAAGLALTGRNIRWDSKQTNKTIWRDGWRNLHGADPTEIEVDLVMTGNRYPPPSG